MKYFGSNDITETIKAYSGMGTIVVDVPFLPDYIKVDFHGGILSPKPDHMENVGNDSVYWNLLTVAPNKYQLAIGWSVYTERDIYYRISQLTVDPV